MNTESNQTDHARSQLPPSIAAFANHSYLLEKLLSPEDHDRIIQAAIRRNVSPITAINITTIDEGEVS